VIRLTNLERVSDPKAGTRPGKKEPMTLLAPERQHERTMRRGQHDSKCQSETIRRSLLERRAVHLEKEDATNPKQPTLD
jgi:hypothetical protein